MSDIPLRDYVDSRVLALETAMEKAESQLRDRLAGMNEFRRALDDQNATFVTKAMMDADKADRDRRIGELAVRIWALEKTQANAAGRTWMAYTLLGLFLTGLALVLRFLV